MDDANSVDFADYASYVDYINNSQISNYTEPSPDKIIGYCTSVLYLQAERG